jgi:hypothetical protein
MEAVIFYIAAPTEPFNSTIEDNISIHYGLAKVHFVNHLGLQLRQPPLR